MLKKKRLAIIILSFVIVASLTFISLSEVYKNRESYKDNLIRFHVLGNSDAPYDQELKIKVRDRVMKEMNEKFNTKDIEVARALIKDNIKEIEGIAKDEIRRNGYDYPVKVMLQDYIFPTKNYGSITLPAGTYEALRIIIGKGEGRNWWCVLFPPLCFIDVEKGLTNEKTREELKGVLSEDEFKMINSAASQKGEIPLKLKFKVVEVLEKSKWRISNLVGLNEQDNQVQ